MPSDQKKNIAFTDLQKTWQESHVSEVPVFVNLCYKAVMEYEKNEPGFINQCAQALHDLVENSTLLQRHNFQEVLNLGEGAQKKISVDQPEHANAAYMLFALLCATIQQQLTLPEFAQLDTESIKTEKEHILALVEHHKKQIA
jgi:hypothetical protein